MVKGVTESGFEFSVDPAVFDDWEVLEYLSEMDDGNDFVAPKFIKKVLGDKQGKALVDHCRDENGRASIKRVTAEIMNVLVALKDGKNS